MVDFAQYVCIVNVSTSETGGVGSMSGVSGVGGMSGVSGVGGMSGLSGLGGVGSMSGLGGVGGETTRKWFYKYNKTKKIEVV